MSTVTITVSVVDGHISINDKDCQVHAGDTITWVADSSCPNGFEIVPLTPSPFSQGPSPSSGGTQVTGIIGNVTDGTYHYKIVPLIQGIKMLDPKIQVNPPGDGHV